MSENNLLSECFERGIEETIRREENNFLDTLRGNIENLFEQDYPPQVLREKLFELIDRSRVPGLGRYYR